MAFQTTCAYCGKYVGKGEGVAANALGLDLSFSGDSKVYCGTKCRDAAKGKAGGAVAGGVAGGVAGAIAGGLASVLKDALSGDMEGDAKQLKAKAISLINGIKFEGDATQIASSLEELWAIHDDDDFTFKNQKNGYEGDAFKAIHETSIKKIELGTVILAKTGDETLSSMYTTRLEEYKRRIAKSKKIKRIITLSIIGVVVLFILINVIF